jgi:hypothetical protein
MPRKRRSLDPSRFPESYASHAEGFTEPESYADFVKRTTSKKAHPTSRRASNRKRARG